MVDGMSSKDHTVRNRRRFRIARKLLRLQRRRHRPAPLCVMRLGAPLTHYRISDPSRSRTAHEALILNIAAAALVAMDIASMLR